MADVLTVAAYSATPWEHACAMYRLVGPARAAGLRLLRGTDWHADRLVNAAPELVGQADLVLIQRDFPVYEGWYQSIIAEATQHQKPVVYDLDDLLLEVPPDNPYAANYDRSRPAIWRGIVQANAVTASTPELCSYLRAFNPNVWVLPNYLDDANWSLVERARPVVAEAGPVVVGYMGGPTHRADLELIAPVLWRLLKRYGRRLRLRFWGAAPPRLRRSAAVEQVECDLRDYADFAAFFATQTADIAIAPLCSNPFNRCKSAIKFLEYSAIGLPGVYSRQPPYESVVRHGENGLLASSLDDWEQALSRLIEDRELRLRMGSAAWHTVDQSWRLSLNAHNWADTYRTLASLPWRPLSPANPDDAPSAIKTTTRPTLGRRDALAQWLRRTANRFRTVQ